MSYIDVAYHIEERVKKHKIKTDLKSFTAKYNCDKLIYFEVFKKGDQAEDREKQFKK